MTRLEPSPPGGRAARAGVWWVWVVGDAGEAEHTGGLARMGGGGRERACARGFGRYVPDPA